LSRFLKHVLAILTLSVATSCATGPSTSGVSHSLTVSNIVARHHSGQTFITWAEIDSNAGYHVYRSKKPIINSEDLNSAEQLTGRWGPLDENTSVNRYGPDHAPERFVVEDLGKPLDNSTGLFVHTVASPGAAYYTVTAVVNGYENRGVSVGVNATEAAVDEAVRTPRSVLTASMNNGKGRLYTQYMDYSRWNPTFNGYAYNYSVALPADYDEQRSYPLQLKLHVFGLQAKYLKQSESNQSVIQIFANDPGEAKGVNRSWWYGYAADHNYKTQGRYPRSGRIENFTEQRLMLAVEEVANTFSVDTNLIHVSGNSMGASGALSLGIRYPGVFAGIYASQPMTNYSENPMFQENFKRLWGSQSKNLPITNRKMAIAPGSTSDSASDHAPDHPLNHAPETGVWDWMNHQLQLRNRRADQFAFLMMDFGKADNVIDWRTQGRPMFSALTDAKVAFSATAAGGVGHEWRDFKAVNKRLFGLGSGTSEVWRYQNSQSFPALTNGTGSGDVKPSATGDDNYNLTIDWSVPGNLFHKPVVDEVNRYELTLRSAAGDQAVDVTPRNTGQFKPAEASNCQWQALGIAMDTVIATGSGVVSRNGLFTALQVPVLETGTRLLLECQV